MSESTNDKAEKVTLPPPPSQSRETAETVVQPSTSTGKEHSEQTQPQSSPSASSASVAGTKVKMAPRKSRGVRRAHMTISRIDPWSALKVGFLLAIGLALMTVLAAVVVWQVLDSMAVFNSLEELLVTLGSEPLLELMQYLEFGRVVSFSMIIGIINIVLFTFLAGIFALLYNGIAMLVGGVHITITDE